MGLRTGSGLLIVLAIFAAFLPALSNDFVAWDDDVNFLMNPHYRGLTGENVRWMFTSFHVGHYMPLTWLTCALDYELWGMDPTGYHLSNIALHALAALLFARVVERLLAPEEGEGSGGGKGPLAARLTAATAGALFFALHPLRVESVAWATERRDVLSGVFLMLTVLAWLRASEGGAARRRWRALSLAAFACSLLSKVSGMTLPLALLALDAFPLRRLRRLGDARAALLDKVPYLALAAAGALLGYLGQRESTDLLASVEGVPLSQRGAIAAYGLSFYVWKTVLPFGLAPLYEIPPELDPTSPVFLAAGTFVVATSVVLWLARRRPAGAAALAAWVAYLLLIAPLTGLLQSGRQIAADRYSYVACLPFAVLFAAAVKRTWGGPWVPGLPVAGLVLIGLGTLTHRQTAHWRDTATLFQRVVAVDPESYLGHRKLGIAHHEAGRHDEAIEQYERCLALRPEGGAADAWAGLALSTYERGAPGDLDRTFEALDAALDDDPRQPVAWDLYEQLSLRARRADRLAARYEEALARDPEFAGAWLGLARLRARSEDHAGAVALAERALAADPAAADALNLLGVELSYLGRFPEAEARLRSALALRPGDPAVLTNLGVVLSRTGRGLEATELWRAALAADPGYEPALQLLAPARDP